MQQQEIEQKHLHSRQIADEQPGGRGQAGKIYTDNCKNVGIIEDGHDGEQREQTAAAVAEQVVEAAPEHEPGQRQHGGVGQHIADEQGGRCIGEDSAHEIADNDGRRGKDQCGEDHKQHFHLTAVGDGQENEVERQVHGQHDGAGIRRRAEIGAQCIVADGQQQDEQRHEPFLHRCQVAEVNIHHHP